MVIHACSDALPRACTALFAALRCYWQSLCQAVQDSFTLLGANMDGRLVADDQLDLSLLGEAVHAMAP